MNLGRELVGAVNEPRRKETRTCHECDKVGHLRAVCREKARGGGRKPDLTLAVGEASTDKKEVWILDRWSSRHLVTNASWLDAMQECRDECVQPDGNTLRVTKRGTLTLMVTANGIARTVKFTNVYYAENVVHNLLSYGQLDQKGYSLMRKNGRRFVAAHGGEDVAFVVYPGRARQGEERGKGTLVEFHKRLGHLNYDAIERLARGPSSGIEITDNRRVNGLACAQGKQSMNRQSRKDTGLHSPIDRIGGVICSDLKGPMTPRDRLKNRYMINFVDHKTNYCRVFLAKTKDAAAKQFEHFLTFFEKRFDCRIHVLRTDSGGEYQNVDLICKTTWVHDICVRIAAQFLGGHSVVCGLCSKPVADQFDPGAHLTDEDADQAGAAFGGDRSGAAVACVRIRRRLTESEYESVRSLSTDS
ncbi:unnamed protein product [Phytophthora fragariaefolia]|uniref:Unnamed protein product n=1 Tax=Phytophthora fragariaefolia TaxID=1490495 RepID=A0A9W6YF26_9STRA|nr:unnamed protein product [Phytophthora fragariaefolia]